ncbi:MAG TPA: glycosyltransferase family 4 protein [Syntrophorhabdaceae bacterium]
MRIGLAIRNFDPRKGGAERYAFDLSTHLAKRGHEVVVFCSGGVAVPGVRLVRLSTVSFPRWLRPLSFALSHRKHVAAASLDVMLGFGNTLSADVYQSHGGVQRVWMEREIASYQDPGERRLKAMLLKSSINQKVQQWVQEYVIRSGKCKRIVAISDMIKGHMAAYYNLGDSAFEVVYNGVDTVRFAPGEPSSDRVKQILFSAGNFRLKGLYPLLLAVAELSRQRNDFHLHVLGRGRKERYTDLIAKQGIGEFVTFLGETGQPEKMYASSQILAHPTFYDACSLTTMEGMAAGLPTISTRWNGASALISPKEGYVLDEPGDIAGLASALRDLLDEDVRREMGRNARAKLEEFTIERNASEMERILVEVGNGKPIG